LVITFVYIIIGIIIFYLIIRVLFARRRFIFSKLAEQELQQYLKYLFESALTDNGSIHIKIDDVPIAVNVKKYVFQNKPFSVQVVLSSGYVERNNIAAIAAYFSNRHIGHSLHYTHSREELHRMKINLSSYGMSISQSIVQTLKSMLIALDYDESASYTISVYGPIKRGFTIQDGNIIKRSFAYSLGRYVGALIRWIRAA
jgi:hypothetical protein